MGDFELDDMVSNDLNREFMESSQSHFFDPEEKNGLAKETEDFDVSDPKTHDQ